MFKVFLITTLVFTQAWAISSISSVHNGLQLTNELGLARMAAWSPQNQLEFSGYGPIKMNNLCLHSKGMGFASWRPCVEGSKSQIWGFQGETLKTEEGYCAEVESYTNSTLNPRVIVKICRENKTEQKWKTHE